MHCIGRVVAEVSRVRTYKRHCIRMQPIIVGQLLSVDMLLLA
jgi:hypothetical protein